MRALVNNAADRQTQGGSSITQQLVKLTLVQQATTKEQVRGGHQAVDRPQDPRAQAGDRVRGGPHEGRDPRALLQHRLLRRRLVRHPVRGQPLLLGQPRQARRPAGRHRSPGWSRTRSSSTRRVYPERALQRRNTVLGAMASNGKISQQEADDLMAKPLGLKITSFPNGCVTSNAAFSCDYVRRYLLAEPALGATVEERRARLERGGLTIKSSIDMRMQRAINKAVKTTVAPKDRAIGAIALVEPGTGKVRGLSQSRPMGRDKKAGESYINFAVSRKLRRLRSASRPGRPSSSSPSPRRLKKGIPVSKTYNSPQNLTMPAGTYFDCEGGGTGTWRVSNSTGAGTHEHVHRPAPVGEHLLRPARARRRPVQHGQGRRGDGHHRAVRPRDRRHRPGRSVHPRRHRREPPEMAAAYATAASGGMYCEPQPVDADRRHGGQGHQGVHQGVQAGHAPGRSLHRSTTSSPACRSRVGSVTPTAPR